MAEGDAPGDHTSAGSADAPTDAELEAAIDALSDPARLGRAQDRLAPFAPQLGRILDSALEQGGWFGEAHRSALLKAATMPDPEERLAAVGALVAEETRLGMLVGVAVGWELAFELERGGGEGPDDDDGES